MNRLERLEQVEKALERLADAVDEFSVSLLVNKSIVISPELAEAANEARSALASQPQAQEGNEATHKPRYSDSSLYDYVCEVCGAKDYAIGKNEMAERPCAHPAAAKEKCPDALTPDGPVCPRCGERRGPSGVDGGSWVHY